MKEIQTELQVFLSLYHKKKDLVEALDLVLLEKKKMEHDLDGNIKSKEETLSKKRKGVIEDNSVLLGGGRCKRVKFSDQLKSTKSEVKQLSERIDDTEQELSSLEDTISTLTGDIGDIQEQVQGLLDDY
jgi:septation ring formation regulator EzrA